MSSRFIQLVQIPSKKFLFRTVVFLFVALFPAQCLFAETATQPKTCAGLLEILLSSPQAKASAIQPKRESGLEYWISRFKKEKEYSEHKSIERLQDLVGHIEEAKWDTDFRTLGFLFEDLEDLLVIRDQILPPLDADFLIGRANFAINLLQDFEGYPIDREFVKTLEALHWRLMAPDVYQKLSDLAKNKIIIKSRRPIVAFYFPEAREFQEKVLDKFEKVVWKFFKNRQPLEASDVQTVKDVLEAFILHKFPDAWSVKSAVEMLAALDRTTDSSHLTDYIVPIFKRSIQVLDGLMSSKHRDAMVSKEIREGLVGAAVLVFTEAMKRNQLDRVLPVFLSFYEHDELRGLQQVLSSLFENYKKGTRDFQNFVDILRIILEDPFLDSYTKGEVAEAFYTSFITKCASKAKIYEDRALRYTDALGDIVNERFEAAALASQGFAGLSERRTLAHSTSMPLFALILRRMKYDSQGVRPLFNSFGFRGLRPDLDATKPYQALATLLGELMKTEGDENIGFLRLLKE